MSSRRRRRRHVVNARRSHPGAAPGTLVVDPEAVLTSIDLFSYGPDTCVETHGVDIAQVRAALGAAPVVWVNVVGLGDVDQLRAIGELFQLHRLALEDVVNVHQRPKVEEYPEHLFLVSRMYSPGDTPTEQLSLFIGDGFLLSFQERPGDCFDPVRQRIRDARGRIRNLAADYLAYALIDAVVDNYFPNLEQQGDRIEEIEGEILTNPHAGLVASLHGMKREFLNLRRIAWAQREALATLMRDRHRLIQEETLAYLRDAQDHTLHVLEIVETYRELATGLVDLYLSTISNRMNEVMKVLTIISTIFIPLGFIAGVYGMNFDTSKSPLNMPELGWYWGYPLCLALMSAIAGIMLVFFYRRGWIGSGAE